MSIGSENQQDFDLDMCGISRSYSQTKLPKVKGSNNEIRCGFVKFVSYQIDSTKREDLQTSVQLNDLNILGLKDYYTGSFDNTEKQPKKQEQVQEIDNPFNEQFTTTLDQLGYKLNEVIGHYLTELTSQSRLSLDSFELQKSENLDEEQQQQIMDLELNTIRQRIYKQIVDKINLSVIQSVRSIQSSSQLMSQSNIQQSQAFSKELISTQVSQISQKSPSKSLTLSLLDLQQQLHQSSQGKKIQEQNIYMDCEGTKEELQNKLKISLQLNYQQSQVNNNLREELQKHNHIDQVDELSSLQQENSKLRDENQALKEALLNKTCEKCKESFKKI